MPKLIVTFAPEKVAANAATWSKLGKRLSVLTATICSTDDTTLDPETDVDFILMPLTPGSIAADISFELETIAYPARMEKLNDAELMSNLKRDFIDTIRAFDSYFPKISDDKPLIWPKPVPIALHV